MPILTLNTCLLQLDSSLNHHISVQRLAKNPGNSFRQSLTKKSFTDLSNSRAIKQYLIYDCRVYTLLNLIHVYTVYQTVLRLFSLKRSLGQTLGGGLLLF